MRSSRKGVDAGAGIEPSACPWEKPMIAGPSSVAVPARSIPLLNPAGDSTNDVRFRHPSIVPARGERPAIKVA